VTLAADRGLVDRAPEVVAARLRSTSIGSRRLPGIERVILEADPPACKRSQLTLAELGAKLHAMVET